MTRPRVSLRLDAWPSIDRSHWEAACAAGSLLEVGGRAAMWRSKTRECAVDDYGRFLAWLQQEGRLVPVSSPAERLTRDNLAGYLQQLRTAGLAPYSVLSRIKGLRNAVRAMVPDADLRLIGSVCSKLKAMVEPINVKQCKVVPTPILIDVATREYDRQVQSGSGNFLGMAARIRARDAMMMMFLAYLPLRLESFSRLCIGRNVIRQADGHLLRLARGEVKEKQPYECVLPAGLTPYLDHYVRQVRPRLLRDGQTDRLWVSMRGTGMAGHLIYTQIITLTRRLLGKAINPHAFRDCLMTTIATEAPESVRAGARILGHRDLRTSEKHYNFASVISAQRMYFAIREKHLRKTRPESRQFVPAGPEN